VLNSQQMLKKPTLIYDVIGLPSGLIGTDCDTWRAHRKVINPTFNPKMLQSFLPIFVEKTEKLVESISKNVGGEEFDLLVETMQCTVATICGRFG
jgi:cytochrome P450